MMNTNDFIQSYMNSPEKQKKLYNRTLLIVVIPQMIGGAMSGTIVTDSSFEILSITGGLLSLIRIPMVFWSTRDGQTV
ncbi:hypothetical protein [Salinicoccus sp. YB14-2]|uniref:hypothetical protein n=1 Tax=Salinicoccus sp. YB14-2 TaxID=1572701 RepID=UPI000AE3A166|nr:hypothetical protein [Salinicoccus sp. YB14-2]